MKNFYLYKRDNETPVRVAPWDYDHSFGRDGDSEMNQDIRPLDITRSILFKRLMKYDWYKDALKNRWDQLIKKDILSKRSLKKFVTVESKGLRSLAEKNFEKWPIDSEWYFDSYTYDQEIELILDFIDLRHDRLTRYFNEL